MQTKTTTPETTDCPECHGDGCFEERCWGMRGDYVVTHECEECGGTGMVEVETPTCDACGSESHGTDECQEVK